MQEPVEKQKVEVPEPPRGLRARIGWLGPGIVWLAAGAGGAGELLFPPRIGSLYGYALLWALVLAVVFKWSINREVGRLSVTTGGSLLDGLRTLPGPRNWAIWVFLAPQVLVALSALAGLASSAATALILVLPGPILLWVGAILVSTMILLLVGRYALLERVATLLAIALAITGIAAALSVFPPPEKLTAGLVPRLPAEVDYLEILPWLSFVLAGAAGMIWYSYWLPAKGYGAAAVFTSTGRAPKASEYNPEQILRLRGWIRQMTFDNTLGVVGGFLIVTAFLILGAEVLGPASIVPEQNRVAEVLGLLLEGSWGRIGFWIMVGGVLVGFYNTTLTNQDGWARMFGNGTQILAGRAIAQRGAWSTGERLRKAWVVALTAGAFGVFVWMGEPVRLLQLAGIIEAFQIPLVAFLVLYLNRTGPASELRPGRLATGLTLLAGLFYALFAVTFVLAEAG